MTLPPARPVIGLAMIVRDEAATILNCLQTIAPYVDHVAILDTGSKDQTVALATEYLEGLDGVDYTIASAAWTNDFAAARQQAELLLPTAVTWTVWADADDIIRGGQQLHALAAAAPDHVGAFGFDYDYAQDPHGNTVCRLKRERLVRRGHGEWVGRVHEAQTITGHLEWVPPVVAEWVHQKTIEAAPRSSGRNLRILRAWIKDDPTNTRLLAYLGTEEAGAGRVKQAIRYFRRYMLQDVAWPEERAQVHRKLAGLLFATGDVDGALNLALQAIRVHPEWPDSYLTLAEAHYRLGEYQHAESHARRVLELGPPAETLLIINPLDYTFQPRLVLAGAIGEQDGRLTEALEVAEDALRIVPDDPRIATAARAWKSRLKRDQVAAGVVAHARTLIAHDEQAKALRLLEDTVPFFCVDHPDVVVLRSQLRERLLIASDPAAYAAHYVSGGSKPEDFTTDELAVEIAGTLPRARFLLAGLAEQAAA